MHQRVRKEFWGYAEQEQLDNQALIKEQYRGIRPAPGYPACPDHTVKRAMFQVLDAHETLTAAQRESRILQALADAPHGEALQPLLSVLGQRQGTQAELNF